MKVGITGHRTFANQNQLLWAKDSLSSQIEQLDAIQGLTSLAIGADQIFAELLIERGHDYIYIEPCKLYETTFSIPERVLFRKLRLTAKSIVDVPYIEPCDEAYMEAGVVLVDMADLIFAVWDGKPARGLGGTSDVVQYALSTGTPVTHIDVTQMQIFNLNSR